MDRRQLLQALGLTVTAAAFAACDSDPSALGEQRAAPPRGGPFVDRGRGFKAVAFNHIAYLVPDYVRVRDFFVELYGMRVVWDDGTQCAVEFGDPPNAIYIRPLQPGEKEKELGTAGPWAGQTGEGFVHHVAFSIENFDRDAVQAELKRRGLDPRPGGPRVWRVSDPAGYEIQLCDVHGVFPGAGHPGAKASDGLKNLASAPKPGGAHNAYAVSHFVLNVPDVANARDFYMDLLGMQLLYYKPGDVAGVEHDGGPVCFLRFGKNTFYLRKSRHPEDRAYVSHFSPVVENFDQAAVKADLDRRGFEPRPDSKFAWSITDPAGMRIEVAGWGLPEHIGGDCNGDIGGCPGGRSN
jgi:catechol 2,3-dioxygenase-like lactoylglutathione lyase family enzyme